MRIYELYINGELISTAGADDLCVLSQTLSAVGKLGESSNGASRLREGEEIELTLGGLTSRTSEPSNLHFMWFRTKALGVGDEVTIRIVEGSKADRPLESEADAVERATQQHEEFDRRRYEDAKQYYLENKDRFDS